MREILFRGKSKATGDWRMGWYQPDFEYKWELTEKDARHSDAAICFLNYNTRPDWSYVDANTVGQYNGQNAGGQACQRGGVQTDGCDHGADAWGKNYGSSHTQPCVHQH